MGMSIGPHEPAPHVGRRPRLTTEPKPKLRIYHHVTGETAPPPTAPPPKLRLVTVSQGRTTQHGPRPILHTWLRARRSKLRLTTEPEPKLRIYRYVTAETASRDDESGPNCAARAS
jgi:hypothetical protein